jgi:hypothetical protein
MRTFTLRIGARELQHDRDYGIDRRTGWSAVVDGIVVCQFVGFPRAAWAWIFAKRTRAAPELPDAAREGE